MRAKLVAIGIATLLLGSSRPSLGNGRFPATTNVHVGGDDESISLVPATFGLLLSTSGQAYRWICEDALGYGGEYDPFYAIATDESMWMTSFDGVRVTRDGGCTWTSVGAPFDDLFPGALTVDSAGRLWAVTAQAGMANNVFRNSDPSASDDFVALGFAGDEGSILTSIVVAPSNTQRAYVGGFVIPTEGDPYPLLYRTDDGGTSWIPLDVGSLELGSQPQVVVAAVSPTDPDLVFVRIGRSVSAGGDVLYRSANAGGSFSSVLTIAGEIIAVLVRKSGDVLVGLGDVGGRISTNGGVSFSTIEGAPQLRCLTETADGALLGCGNNGEPDRAALATSSDGLTWSSIMRFSDIAAPLDCPAGTVQHDTCAELVWPGLAEQLGLGDAGPMDGDAGVVKPPNDGCGCRAHGPPSGGVALCGATLLMLALRRRRRG